MRSRVTHCGMRLGQIDLDTACRIAAERLLGGLSPATSENRLSRGAARIYIARDRSNGIGCSALKTLSCGKAVRDRTIEGPITARASIQNIADARHHPRVGERLPRLGTEKLITQALCANQNPVINKPDAMTKPVAALRDEGEIPTRYQRFTDAIQTQVFFMNQCRGPASSAQLCSSSDTAAKARLYALSAST